MKDEKTGTQAAEQPSRTFRRRDKYERADARARIAEMRLKHKTIREIAATLGLGIATIHRELQVIEQEWQEKSKEVIDQVKARELAKLDVLEAEAMEAWERSKLDYQRRSVTEKPKNSPGGGRVATIETGTQHGDPRLMKVILDIMERRAKLLGADAPTKVAPTSPDGNEPAQGFVLALPPVMSAEEWAQTFSKPSG